MNLLIYLLPVLLQCVEFNFAATIGSNSTSETSTVQVVDKEDNDTTEAAVVTDPQRKRTCTCSEGKCRCCSGAVMEALNFPINQKLCVDILYTPEEFQFDFNVNFNERILYKNKISGKNPRPLCLPLTRYLPVNVCLKFSNIYMISRNIHACLDVEGSFLEAEIFEVSFECFRLGSNGIAFLKPEDGGGLTETSQGGSNSEDSDYDDSA